MKTYEAVISMSIIVEANNKDEVYEMARNWYREETHPDYNIKAYEIEVEEV